MTAPPQDACGIDCISARNLDMTRPTYEKKNMTVTLAVFIDSTVDGTEVFTSWVGTCTLYLILILRKTTKGNVSVTFFKKKPNKSLQSFSKCSLPP